jgi:poly-beta-1,6-N-acetyl-D-glucosamine synthase
MNEEVATLLTKDALATRTIRREPGLTHAGAEGSPGEIFEPGTRRPKLSIVTCAYNEEANIGRFLRSCIESTAVSYDLAEIIVVSSGCTDRTEEIVSDFHASDKRIHLVVQPNRLGKAYALGQGLREAKGDIVLVAGADTSAAKSAFEEIVRPFSDPDVSLVCARPVPMTTADNFVVNLIRTLWDIHLQVSIIVPKAGEAYAVRNRAYDVPADVEDDDTYLGAVCVIPGTRSVFAEGAVFYNRIPRNPADFLRQRWRINRQVLGLERATGIKSSTWLPLVLLRAVGGFLRQKPQALHYVVTLATAEAAVRTGAILTTWVIRRPLVKWAPIPSTKDTADLGQGIDFTGPPAMTAAPRSPTQWHR